MRLARLVIGCLLIFCAIHGHGQVLKPDLLRVKINGGDKQYIIPIVIAGSKDSRVALQFAPTRLPQQSPGKQEQTWYWLYDFDYSRIPEIYAGEFPRKTGLSLLPYLSKDPLPKLKPEYCIQYDANAYLVFPYQGGYAIMPNDRPYAYIFASPYAIKRLFTAEGSPAFAFSSPKNQPLPGYTITTDVLPAIADLEVTICYQEKWPLAAFVIRQKIEDKIEYRWQDLKLSSPKLQQAYRQEDKQQIIASLFAKAGQKLLPDSAQPHLIKVEPCKPGKFERMASLTSPSLSDAFARKDNLDPAVYFYGQLDNQLSGLLTSDAVKNKILQHLYHKAFASSWSQHWDNVNRNFGWRLQVRHLCQVIGFERGYDDDSSLILRCLVFLYQHSYHDTIAQVAPEIGYKRWLDTRTDLKNRLLQNIYQAFYGANWQATWNQEPNLSRRIAHISDLLEGASPPGRSGSKAILTFWRIIYGEDYWPRFNAFMKSELTAHYHQFLLRLTVRKKILEHLYRTLFDQQWRQHWQQAETAAERLHLHIFYLGKKLFDANFDQASQNGKMLQPFAGDFGKVVQTGAILRLFQVIYGQIYFLQLWKLAPGVTDKNYKLRILKDDALRTKLLEHLYQLVYDNDWQRQWQAFADSTQRASYLAYKIFGTHFEWWLEADCITIFLDQCYRDNLVQEFHRSLAELLPTPYLFLLRFFINDKQDQQCPRKEYLIPLVIAGEGNQRTVLQFAPTRLAWENPTEWEQRWYRLYHIDPDVVPLVKRLGFQDHTGLDYNQHIVKSLKTTYPKPEFGPDHLIDYHAKTYFVYRQDDYYVIAPGDRNYNCAYAFHDYWSLKYLFKANPEATANQPGNPQFIYRPLSKPHKYVIATNIRPALDNRQVLLCYPNSPRISEVVLCYRPAPPTAGANLAQDKNFPVVLDLHRYQPDDFLTGVCPDNYILTLGPMPPQAFRRLKSIALRPGAKFCYRKNYPRLPDEMESDRRKQRP